MFACERARKLLSQLPDAKITVENLVDSGDANFSIRREDFATITSDLIERFIKVIKSAIENSTLNDKSFNISSDPIAAVEILGGGVRMPSIQNAIINLFGNGDSLPLGAKFDDASVALGAALIASRYLEGSSGRSFNQLILLLIIHYTCESRYECFISITNKFRRIYRTNSRTNISCS